MYLCTFSINKLVKFDKDTIFSLSGWPHLSALSLLTIIAKKKLKQ